MPIGTAPGKKFCPRAAQDKLAPYPNARVVRGNGAVAAFEAADVIYVNAGATRPVDTWLDALEEGG